jgi:hypothetical protein
VPEQDANVLRMPLLSHNGSFCIPALHKKPFSACQKAFWLVKSGFSFSPGTADKWDFFPGVPSKTAAVTARSVRAAQATQDQGTSLLCMSLASRVLGTTLEAHLWGPIETLGGSVTLCVVLDPSYHFQASLADVTTSVGLHCKS